MKRCLSLLIALLLLTGCALAEGSAGAWSFADEGVERSAREALGLEDGPVGAEALAGITEIEVDANDLTDLAAMTGLEKLTLGIREAIPDLSPLTGLEKLRELTLGWYIHGDDTPGLAQLQALTGLESLCLSNQCVDDLSALAGLGRLKRLEFEWDGEADIGPLAELPLLEELILWAPAVSTANLEALSRMRAMRKLTLRSDWMASGTLGDMDDIGPLGRLTQLEELNLELGQYELPDLTPLASLTNLRRLSLCHTNSDVMGHGTISDLSPLGSLAALEELDLGGNDMADISGLAGLTNLRVLGLCNCGIEDLSALSTLTGLESLDMGDWVSGEDEYGEVRDIACLAGLTNLRKLELFCQDIDDLTPLAGLTALESLDISGTRVADLTPLAGLTALETLHIGGTRVTDLTPLAGMTALRELTIGYTEVADLTPLAGLTALETLDIRGTRVTDLTPLAELTALKELNISYTQVEDLTPLAGLTALEKLNIRGTRAENGSTSEDDPPADDEAPAKGEPSTGSVTFTTEILANGQARTDASEALYATATITLTVRDHWLPEDFQRAYGSTYRLKGTEAGVSFDLSLDDFDGDVAFIPQYAIMVTLRNANGGDDYGYVLIDAWINGNHDVSVAPGETKRIYKRYEYSSQFDVRWLCVTAFVDGQPVEHLFDLGEGARADADL